MIALCGFGKFDFDNNKLDMLGPPTLGFSGEQNCLVLQPMVFV